VRLSFSETLQSYFDLFFNDPNVVMIILFDLIFREDCITY
jgi:hypothetical protein